MNHGFFRAVSPSPSKELIDIATSRVPLYKDKRGLNLLDDAVIYVLPPYAKYIAEEYEVIYELVFKYQKGAFKYVSSSYSKIFEWNNQKEVARCPL